MRDFRFSFDGKLEQKHQKSLNMAYFLWILKAAKNIAQLVKILTYLNLTKTRPKCANANRTCP